MEFKDNSRRRTLVLVVGVLLALGAGAAAFMLSSEGTETPETVFPTRDIVVAAELIPARTKIDSLQLSVRSVPVDDTNSDALTDRDAAVGKLAAIPILQFQPITENMLAKEVGVGQIDILEPNETVAPDSPVLRAVSLTVPANRAGGGLIAPGQRVDVLATLQFPVAIPIDPDTGAIETDPETGDPVALTPGLSSKPMWLDLKVLAHPEGTDQYVMRMDMHQAEELALAQATGADFTLLLRPEVDTRDVDRSSYGNTTDRLLTRYNFAIPERIDGLTYAQPAAFPSPYPAEPYLSPEPLASPSPEAALIDIPVDETGTDGEVSEETPAP